MKKDLGAKALLFPTPLLIVATYDAEGKPNAMAAAWGGICCSAPPCVAISLRKATYTYDSLMEKKAFTINIPGQEHVREADYLGIASGRNGDKLARAGLTPVKSELVDAPYIEEFPVNLECKIVNVLELGLHTQFVGEVLNVKMNGALQEDGEQTAIERMKPFVFAPDDGHYYALGEKLAKAFSAGKSF